jgi:parvulin-like peptidyl-prolyl isomerase
VETQYGWHLIEALTDVTPANKRPLASVKEQIRQQLLQERRQQAITDWSKELNEEFEDKVTYQVGFSPPATTGTTADQ